MAVTDLAGDRKRDDGKRPEADPETMLDVSQAAVKKMIADAKAKGYITYDQLNDVLPPEQVSSEQIEDVMSMLSEMGINIIEDEEPEEVDEKSTDVVVSQSSTEVLDRTDDPVRMYMREMGVKDLLSREGEIAIAKRFVAGLLEVKENEYAAYTKVISSWEREFLLLNV